MSKPPETPKEAAAPARPFQFGLRTLLALPVVLALLLWVFISCYPYSLAGAGFGAFCATGLAFFDAVSRGVARLAGVRRRRRNMTLADLLGIAAVLFVIMSFLGRRVNPERGEARRSSCSHNLKHIALALQNYHDDYGCFPPAYVVDDADRRLHSWRVLILPYLGQKGLYSQYDFDEPWDGPNNRRLARAHVREFECPEEGVSTPTTSYVAIVGPGTAWPGSRSAKFDDFTDGRGNTLLLVETVNSGIHWMEPKDLEPAEMGLEINPREGPGISSWHFAEKLTGRYPNGANSAAADGSVHYLSNHVSAEQLRALITIDGGESVTFDDLPKADR